MTVIFILSAQHRVPTAGMDAGLVAAAGHLIAYGCLALALRLGLEKYGFDMRVASRLAILLALLYGASDELHQAFVPGRHADPIDLFLDFTGAVVGTTIFDLLRKAPQRPGPSMARAVAGPGGHAATRDPSTAVGMTAVGEGKTYETRSRDFRETT